MGGHMTNPRPGLEPGPRPTPSATLEVPDQARDGLFLLLVAALTLLLLTTPTHAQILPTGSPAADILLSQAITEHRVFLTCSALDPETHARISADWQADITSAKAILASHDVPPETVAAFTAAADPQALMPPPDTAWAEVQALCATRSDWRQAYDNLDRVMLDLKLVGVLE